MLGLFGLAAGLVAAFYLMRCMARFVVWLVSAAVLVGLLAGGLYLADATLSTVSPTWHARLHVELAKPMAQLEQFWQRPETQRLIETYPVLRVLRDGLR